jgi:6-pyruvoyl-tetrahydropterin synthase
MLKNVSRQAVSKKIKTGKLDGAIVNHNGKKKVNKEEAFRLWDLQASPSKDTTVKKQLKKEIYSKLDDEIPNYAESKAKREHFLAELARLDVEQKKKDLIPVTDIKKSSFEMGRAIREKLTNLADRLANQIAGETDAQIIHKLLTEEHRTALEELVEV